MIQPDELKSTAPLTWSPGRGGDVWELLCACIAGDVSAVQRLLERDPALVRCQYVYRTPLYFAVRENQLDVARLLLERGADPLSLAVNDSLLDICRDRVYADMEQLLSAHLETVCNASPRGETVAAAIREHDLEKVRRLLDASPELLHAGDQR